MATFTGRVVVQVLGELLGSNDLGTVDFDLDRRFATIFKNGTGLGQANNIFADTRSLAGGANENLDLSGVLANAFTTTITAVKLKGIVIYARPTNTGNLTITQPASNGVPFMLAAGDGPAPLVPGGLFVFTIPSAAGITVTPSTGDLINVAASGSGANSYDVVLIVAE